MPRGFLVAWARGATTPTGAKIEIVQGKYGRRRERGTEDTLRQMAAGKAPLCVVVILVDPLVL